MNAVRFGRIVINTDHVQSVVRKNGTGNELHTVVTLRDGVVHDFKDHAQAVWDHFKDDAVDVTA